MLQQIKLVDPKLILLTGSTAMRAILEDKDPLSNLRGQWIKKDGREIMVIFHPSYLLRFPSKSSWAPGASPITNKSANTLPLPITNLFTENKTSNIFYLKNSKHENKID